MPGGSADPGAAALAGLDELVLTKPGVGGDHGAASDGQSPGQGAFRRQGTSGRDVTTVDGLADRGGQANVERAGAGGPVAELVLNLHANSNQSARNWIYRLPGDASILESCCWQMSNQ